MFKTLVFIFIMGINTPTTLEDKLGPYDPLEGCFYRGAAILRAVYATRLAIVKSEVVCIKVKRLEKKELKKEDLMVKLTPHKLL